MRRITFCGVVMAVAILSVAGVPAIAQRPAETEISGGSGGDSFSDFQPSAGARVQEVRVRFGERVDSVQLTYILPNGRTVVGPRHGGSGGRQAVFRLGRDEYIVGLSGRCGDSIDSLRIHTNSRTSTLFGGRGGDRDYRITVPRGNEAIGFAGRAGEYVDAIGLTYAPMYVPRRGELPNEASPGRARFEQTPLFGGGGGSSFADDAPPSGARIAEIHVRCAERVDSIQVIYVLPNGRSLEGERHGGMGGDDRIFRLGPDEYITGISGRYGDAVDSLLIHTNRRTSPMFGGRGGNRDYRIDVPRGTQVLGFAGRAGQSVDAIGLSYRR